MRRNRERQLWADIDFINDLKKIKAQMMLNGIGEKGIGHITREMRQCPSYSQLIKELISQRERYPQKIKMDKRLI